jgi:hypothetical protein
MTLARPVFGCLTPARHVSFVTALLVPCAHLSPQEGGRYITGVPSVNGMLPG